MVRSGPDADEDENVGDPATKAVGSLDRETAGRPSRVRFANAAGVPALTTNLRVAKLVPELSIATAVSPQEALYVHAKVAIVDDRWLTVGSANLNEHSLFNDTEINIATCDPMLARHTRLALWAEHLDRTVEEIDHDPTTVIDGLWRPIAEEQVHRRSNGLALTHRLMQLPAVSRRAERLVGPMRGLLIDG